LHDDGALVRWLNVWSMLHNEQRLTTEFVTDVCDRDASIYKMVAHVSCYRDTPEVIDIHAEHQYYNDVCTTHFFIING